MTTVEEQKTPMEVEKSIATGKSDSYLQYLLNTNMSRHEHIPCKRAILKVQIDDRATEVLASLMREGFQSAPVMEGNRCVGFIDMLVLVKYITDTFTFSSDPKQSWLSFYNQREKFANATVREVMMKNYYSYARMQPEVVYEYSSTFSAMESMSDAAAHRLAVLNNRVDRKLVGILTQSMVISELRQRQHLVETMLNKKVGDVISYFKLVQTIRDDAIALNGFKKMSNNHITGLAITNADGVLEDTLSVTDLKGIGANGEHIGNLYKTVKEFKEATREIIPQVAPRAHYSGKQTPILPIYVTPADTLLDVLHKMDDGNIHRVWVCSETSHDNGRPVPTNVITQSDFIKYIVDHYTQGTVWF